MGRTLSLKGIIVPCKWDENDKATAVSISAAGEKEYPIEMNKMGKSLLKHVRHEVYLEGLLRGSEENSADLVRVQFYELHNWKSDDESD